MKKYLDIRNIIILVLTASTALVAINPGGIMPNRVKHLHRIDSVPYPVHDTVPYEVEVEVEVPVEVEVQVEKLVEVPVYQKIDTAEILKIYTAKTEHKDLIVLPNNQGTVAVTDVISQNKVVSRTIDSKIKPKTLIDTVYTPIPRKNELYFGFFGGLSKPDVIPSIGTGVMIKTKDDKIIHGGIGVYNRVVEGGTSGSFTPFISGGVYWKLNFKK
jgi:hypothetical protein